MSRRRRSLYLPIRVRPKILARYQRIKRQRFGTWSLLSDILDLFRPGR